MSNATASPTLATFTLLIDPGMPTAKTKTVEAIGGYLRRARPQLLCLYAGEGGITPLVLEISGDQAIWGGYLRPLAELRYRAAPDGGRFSYRGSSFTRMTAAQVRAAADGKTFTLGFPG